MPMQLMHRYQMSLQQPLPGWQKRGDQHEKRRRHKTQPGSWRCCPHGIAQSTNLGDRWCRPTAGPSSDQSTLATAASISAHTRHVNSVRALA